MPVKYFICLLERNLLQYSLTNESRATTNNAPAMNCCRDVKLRNLRFPEGGTCRSSSNRSFNLATTSEITWISFCLSHFIFLTTRATPQCLRLHDTQTSQTYDQLLQRPTARLSPTLLLPNRFSQLKRLPMPKAQPRKVGGPMRIMIRIVISSVSLCLTVILKSECSLSAKSTLSSWFNCLPQQECQFFSLCRRPRTLPIPTPGSCGSL